MDTLPTQVSLIWTVQLGILMMLILMSLMFMCYLRNRTSVRYVVWISVVLIPIVPLNYAFYGETYQALVPELHWLKVAGPPMAVWVSAYMLGDWFGVGYQSAGLRRGLSGVIALAVLAMLVCPWLPAEEGMLVSTAATLGGIQLIALVCLWQGRHGSRIGSRLGTGIFLFGLVAALHYALVLGWLEGTAMHLFVVTADIIGVMTISAICVQRCLHESQTRAMHNRLGADLDPSTKLLTAKAFVRGLQQALNRLQGRSDSYAVVTVVVDNVPGLLDQLGVGGVHEALCLVAARVRETSGFLTPVGRYYDRCFMVLIDRPQNEQLVKNLVTALRASLREPMTLPGAHNEIQNVQPVAGVAAVYFDEREDVSNILYRAESAALDACGRGAAISPAGIAVDARSERWSSLFPSTSA